MLAVGAGFRVRCCNVGYLRVAAKMTDSGVTLPVHDEQRIVIAGIKKKGIGLAGDLLGLELAVEGFEDPVLEEVAVAGLYFAEGDAEAGGTGVEDHGFSFEGFAGFMDLEQDAAFFFERGGGFEEAALQAEFGDAAGDERFWRGFRSDLGVGVEGKT